MKHLLCICILLCAAPTFAAEEPAPFYSDLTPAAFTPTDGPLTNAMNLRVRTDENGYLLATVGTYGGTDGPLTAFGNLRLRTDSNGYLLVGLPAGAGAPVGAKYIVQQADATLTAEQATGALATGLVKNTTTTGVLSIAAAGTDYQAPITCADTGVVFASAANTVGCDITKLAFDDTVDSGVLTLGGASPDFVLGTTANGTGQIIAGAAGVQLQVEAGAGTNGAASTGGELTLRSGNGSPDGNGDGGDITVTSGAGNTGAQSGNVSITSGLGDDTGDVSITSGNTTTGDSGNVRIHAGASTLGEAGYVEVVGGNGTAGATNGNDAYIQGGQSIGGMAGAAYLIHGNLSTGIHTTTTGVTVDGSVLLTDGKSITGDTTTAHTWLLQAYDNDTGPSYVTFGTLTNGNSPSLVIAPPAGGATVSVKGRYIAAGATPGIADTSANSCGTGTETIAGTDNAGKVTVIGSAGTSCTVTFATAWANEPSCFVTNETTANLARATSTTTTVILAGVFAQNDVLAYGCTGR